MPVKNQLVMPRIFFLLTVVIFVLFIYLLAPILQPFFIAALIAYLSNPLVDRLERLKLPRILGVLVVFLLMLSLLILLGLFLAPLLIDQLNLLIHKLPSIIDWFQVTAIPWINSMLGSGIQINMQNLNVALMDAIKNHQAVIGKIFSTLTTSGMTIVSIIFQMLLVPVVTFYLLRDWNRLLSNCRKILPRRIEPVIVLLSMRYNEVLRAFLRGQLLVIILLGIIYTTGLWIIGLQFAVLIGVIAGLLNIVPYLGFTIGLFSGLFAAYYQFHDFDHVLYVLIVFLIGQSIESMLLTPLLVGDSIGLHPVAVIFSVITGGFFLGFVGALIALPVAAAIMVLMRYWLAKYYRSFLYSL